MNVTLQMAGGTPMDYQSMFNIAVTLIFFLAGWVLKSVTDAVQRLDADVRAMPQTYVAKVDYRNDLAEIKRLLERIETKLDGKADKV